jgi:hypothetical protein
MLMSQLILHRGARVVSREELDEVPTPNPTHTWFPVGHSHVLDQATETLGKAGFLVRKQSLALSREGARFFGTLDLECPLVTGVLALQWLSERKSFKVQDRAYLEVPTEEQPPIGRCLVFTFPWVWTYYPGKHNTH